jgi:hypothetical protein
MPKVRGSPPGAYVIIRNMRVTLSLPDRLAERFLALVPNRERSSTVARLLEKELARRESELGRACQSANADSVLAEEVAEWQSFDDAAPAKRKRRSR